MTEENKRPDEENKRPDDESQAPAAQPEERLATSRDQYLAGKDVGVSYSPTGKLGFNEPTLDLVKTVADGTPGSFQFVHRVHECLIIPAHEDAPNSTEIKYGVEARTASCNGRRGIYRGDVPEAKKSNVRLVTTVRTREEEPKWGPCLAVSFKGAERIVPRRKKQDDEQKAQAKVTKAAKKKAKAEAKAAAAKLAAATPPETKAADVKAVEPQSGGSGTAEKS